MAQDKVLTLGAEVPPQLIVLAFLCSYLTTMFLVRLLVFLASAAFAFWTLQHRRREFAVKTFAVASMFPRSQSTFRLGSGAVLYPRTSLDLDDEPDTTTSTTALPTLIVNEVYLGSLSLDDLVCSPRTQ